VVRLVRDAIPEDVASWLELADEVEDLFGPMPDIEEHLRRGIARGTAVVVVDGPAVAGAALLSREDEPHAIHWLSVRFTQRRTGVAHLLMEEILRRWPIGDVEVTTFGLDVGGGAAARRLYARFGFEAVGPADPGPNGTSRDRYVLRR
jgi:GNAT superfamily N-acetyltransferase